LEHGIAYLGRPNHLRLANRKLELLLSTEYGPRIIRCAPIGGENLFAELPPGDGYATPFGEPWHAYGGHRLWHAPEDPVRTYWPDNKPVAFSARDGKVLLVQGIESHTLLRKSMEITLDPDEAKVTVVHRIENDGAFPVQLALWALTMMAPGGAGIYPNAPFKPFPEDLLPVRPLVLWSYTRLADPRWTWGDRLFQLRQDPARKDPQKVGFYNAEGWLAYRRGDVLFIKEIDPAPMSRAHVDEGSNCETFTNHEMLELETLSPFVRIAPGTAAEHVERWRVATGVDWGEGEAGLWDAIQRARGDQPATELPRSPK
jgi:hypothetical protein